MAIFITENVDLRIKVITRDLKTIYNDKAPMHQRVMKILNLHESNYRVAKYMNQKLTALNGKTDKPALIFGYFYTTQS